MKQFFKYVVATITGLFILGAIFFIVLISMVSGMKEGKKVESKSNSVVVLNLNYPMNDRTGTDPFEELASGLSGKGEKAVGMYDVIKTIEHAKTDENVEGILLDLTYLNAGYGKLAEVRDALVDFKTSGKFVYAYGEVYYNRSYYFASVADSVFLNPKGSMMFNGMSAEVLFFKETLAKLGIEMQAIKHGEFKGAVEPFVLDGLSEQNRYQIDTYVQSVYSNFIHTIGSSRGIEDDVLKELANKFDVSNPNQALEHNLVDQLVYRDQMMSAMSNRMEVEEVKDIKLVKLAKYRQTIKPNTSKGKDRIAVIYANGNIVSGYGETNEIGSEKFAKALKSAREDEDVKAVVLRVNSPGGSALASDVIWRESTLLKNEKPLIVSMGDVAASGGYYISCLADTIFAMPNTITGSIGVFGMFPNAEKMLEKLGLHSEFIKTSEYADFGRIDRALNEKEVEILTTVIEDIYEDFVGIVSDGRGLSTDYVDSIGGGRVWTGTMAKENGLVDIHGGLLDAIDMAASKAGLENYKIKSYPKEKNPFEEIFASFSIASIKEKVMKSELGANYKIYEQISSLEKLNGIQAIMPFTLSPN
jgi:protease IV